MSQPIRGFEGEVVISDIATGFISNWQLQIDRQEQVEGPFIGDNGTLYPYTTTTKYTGSLSATIPSGKDSGQTALLSGALNGSYISMRLTSTGGYTFTIPSGNMTKVTVKQEAKGTVTLDADFSVLGTISVS